MGRVKKQHYVPQGYLRGFADRRGRVFVFDKVTKDSFRTSTANVAAEQGFYDLPAEVEDQLGVAQPIEKLLAPRDQLLAKVVGELEEKLPLGARKLRLEQKFLHLREKEVLSFLLALQVSRTRQFRNVMVEVAEKGMLEVVKRQAAVERPDLSFEGLRLKADEKAGPLYQGRMMFDPNWVSKMMSLLMRHIWIVGVNRTDVLLYTSDTPVVKQAHVEHPVLGTGGYGSPGIEINYPLSPRITLMMCERGHWKELEPMDGRGIGLLEENVIYCNSLQVRDSHRQIFSRMDDFGLARRYCDEHPDVCSTDREFVEVS